MDMLTVHDIVDYHVNENRKMSKVLHTPMDILRLILIDANYDHSFPVHTDLEIQVPT